MPATNYLWSRSDDAIQKPGLARIASLTDDEKYDSLSSRTSEVRSFSSSSSSSASSASSSFSALSDFPLVLKHGSVKVPLHVAATLAHHGFDVDECGRVTWRDNSPSHPRNWSTFRKLYDAAVIVFLEMFTTLVSNTGSSTAVAGAADLGVSRETALICFTTTYLLAQAVGGLILPPIAESFGGRTLYITGAATFTAGCVLMAASPTLPAAVAGRVVCGFMSALPATVAVSSFENMFDVRSRIWVFHIWIASAVAALGFGPAVATYISTSSLGWSWVFCLSAAVSGFSTLLCMAMKESRPSTIIRREIRTITRSSGFDGLFYESIDNVPSFGAFCETSLLLPMRLFCTEPIVFLTSIMAATVCAIIYVFPEAFPVVFADAYGFTPRQCSLVNLAIPVGVVFTFLPRLYDIKVSNHCKRNNIVAQPEDKIFGFLVAAPILAIAFWWFGLTIPPLVTGLSPWIPIASLTLVGFSVVEFDTVLAGYLTDTYTSHAASANASLSFLRAVLSGTLPLSGHRMFSGLGPNYAMFILAGLSTLYCGVAMLFAKYGKSIRMRSRFAQQTLDAEARKLIDVGRTLSIDTTEITMSKSLL